MAALIFWMLLLLLLAVVVGWKDSWRYNSGWNNEARTTDEEKVGVAVVVEVVRSWGVSLHAVNC